MLLKITNGCVSFGANTVLYEIDFEINKGEKIALIGRNGCGKTTLIKLIIGEYELTKNDNGESSSINIQKNTSIGYLSQVTFEDETVTLEDEVKKAYQEILDIERNIEKFLVDIEKDSNLKVIKKYSDLQERFSLLGGYSYKKEYSVAIKEFGFSDEDKAKSLSEFSGGQRTKIAFIKLLLSKPDILLLDEPTNHLDVNAIKWLEEYLKSYKKTIVIVAHDREFLDNIVSIVYEIERGKSTKYSGNYSVYAEKKRLDWELQKKKYIEQQKQVAHLSGLVDRFRYKATKASMAQSKIKQIEKMDIIEDPELADTKGFHAKFEPKHPSVKQVLSVNDLEIGYDKPLSKLSLNIMRGEKIGIIGGNGLGKSTFLKTIVGMIPQLSGKYSVGDKVQIGYFDQHMAQYKSDKTLLDEYWDKFPNLSHTEVRSTLGAFLFSQDDVFKQVNTLSGGEKVRLELCKLLRQRPNFLILDEPTNHMDIISKEILENMLKEYTGTLVFVSHDRYFVKRIATSILLFDIDGVSYYPYGYEQYLEKNEKKIDMKKKSENKEKKKKYINPAKEKAKRATKLKKLETAFLECEKKIMAIKEELESDDVVSDYVKLIALQNQLKEQEDIHLSYLEEWDSLMDENSIPLQNT
ncbi:MAG: ribosomal protection-like ABC-F family protein [Clostridiales bacterium]